MTVTAPAVQLPATLQEATTLLAELGDEGEALAGGTWLMRRRRRRHQVALARVAELHGVRVSSSVSDGVDVGAMTTHTELASVGGGPAFACVRDAARQSAFPQVRNVATVGGNVRAVGFAESDLLPALLAAGAQVATSSPEGTASEDLATYLAGRAGRPAGELVSGVRVPTPAGRSSGFARLTVRAAGEYPVVNVAVSVDVADGVVRAARVAVGSIEPVARLCADAAAALVDRPVGDADAVTAAGAAAVAELSARDGRDAPGWYRLAVLPALVRRAVARLAP